MRKMAVVIGLLFISRLTVAAFGAAGPPDKPAPPKTKGDSPSVQQPGSLQQVQCFTAAALTSANISSKETNLGDLIADAIREAAQSDIALIPAASFSDTPVTVGPGSFQAGKLSGALEFGSEQIAVVKMSGAHLRSALAHSVFLYPQQNSSLLQLSGLTLTVDTKSDGSHHLVSVMVGGAVLQPDHTYTVAMPASLAGGALAYFKYWQASDIEKTLDTTLEQAVRSYLQAHPTVTAGDKRIVEKSS